MRGPCARTMKDMNEVTHPDSSGVMIAMRGISKSFATVTANKDVDLEVRCGEVHGLLGENGAGKTTLMKILFGMLQPDSGRIYVKGQPVSIRSPRDAVDLGIGMVHQHFMLIPDMTVAENVALGLHSERPFVSLKEVERRLDSLSEQFGLRVTPSAYIQDLSVGMRQRVEILKLLYSDIEVLILDEPTSVLTPGEWEYLAKVLESLVARGRSVIFITHKLEELQRVARRCTVLRDGYVVGTVNVEETDKAALARMMVGRDVVLRIPRVPSKLGNPVLELDGFSVRDNEKQLLCDLTLTVHQGEIVGIAGVEGNGQTDLVEAIVGTRSEMRYVGQLRLFGETIDTPSPLEFSRRSGGVITEDRHATGLALSLSLQDNLMMRDFRKSAFRRFGVLRRDVIREHCRALMDAFDVKAPSVDTLTEELSGGNQQKAILARELHGNPKLLIVSQPTRGLDVGAMEFVYTQLLAHKERGGATLLISSELTEVLSLSDRIVVIFGGRFTEMLDPENIDQEHLGLLMAGAKKTSLTQRRV